MASDLTFTIEEATRVGVPALICLWGTSGTGKTMSALKLARGLVGPTGNIGLIDSENNRARIYADVCGPWDHLDLQKPFTPERYTQAIDMFSVSPKKYGCIIVDSTSHVWAGEGGVVDTANQATTAKGAPRTGLDKWREPKMAYKKLMNSFLLAPCHVIFCVRAKDRVEQQGSKVISFPGEHVPIIEKNFIYEMLIQCQINLDHIPLVDKMKCPEELMAAFPAQTKISVGTGEKIAAWIGGGLDWNAELAKIKAEARDIAMLGVDRLREYWGGLANDRKTALKPFMDEFKKIATDVDETEKRARQADHDDEGDKPVEIKAPTPAAGDSDTATAMADAKLEDSLQRMSADTPDDQGWPLFALGGSTVLEVYDTPLALVRAVEVRVEALFDKTDQVQFVQSNTDGLRRCESIEGCGSRAAKLLSIAEANAEAAA